MADKPYYLTEITGKHFDANGDYFVLRLDLGEDWKQLKANRKTINHHAKNIEQTDPELAKSLKQRYPLIK